MRKERLFAPRHRPAKRHVCAPPMTLRDWRLTHRGSVEWTSRSLVGADVLVDGQRTHRVDRAHRRDRRPPSVVRPGWHHYGMTVATCVPADPESKGGVERTVQIGKADVVPTDTNLRDDYASWAELVDACTVFMDRVNGREHRITWRPRAAMLAEEQARLHRLPDVAFTAAFADHLDWPGSRRWHGCAARSSVGAATRCWMARHRSADPCRAGDAAW